MYNRKIDIITMNLKVHSRERIYTTENMSYKLKFKYNKNIKNVIQYQDILTSLLKLKYEVVNSIYKNVL